MADYCPLFRIISSLSLLPLHRRCLSYFVFLFYQALHRVENFPLARRARGKNLLGWRDLLPGFSYGFYSGPHL